jgi:hypothetical protein
MSTPNEPMDMPDDRTAQEPAEGSRETVEAALRHDQRPPGDSERGVSEDVPDA